MGKPLNDSRVMVGDDFETKAEILKNLDESFSGPLRFIGMEAVQFGPEDAGLPAELLEEQHLDKAGWAVVAQREHRLDPPFGLKVLIEPGLELDEVLARLDRIKQELQARPEILSKDWSRPLLETKVALKLVKKG